MIKTSPAPLFSPSHLAQCSPQMCRQSTSCSFPVDDSKQHPVIWVFDILRNTSGVSCTPSDIVGGDVWLGAQVMYRSVDFHVDLRQSSLSLAFGRPRYKVRLIS